MSDADSDTGVQADRHEPTEDLIAALATRGAAEPVLDGRRRRAERGRAAVVRATLELVDAGDPVPAFADIAAASGVSERTIFRYFPDRDALFGAVATEVYPRIAHCLVLEPRETGLADRAEELVRLRLDLAERTAPLARSVERLAPTSQLGAALLGLRTDRLRTQVRTWFAPELERAPLGTAALVDALLTTDSILHLRAELPAGEVPVVLAAALLRLLAPS